MYGTRTDLVLRNFLYDHEYQRQCIDVPQGTVHLPLSNVEYGTCVNMWLPLRARKQGQKALGELAIEVVFTYTKVVSSVSETLFLQCHSAKILG